MRKASLISLIFLALYGCASTKDVPLQIDVFNAARPESIARSVHEKPNFAAATAGKMMFGLLGSLAMIRAGNRIVADNGIEDPAMYIGKVLADQLSESHGIRIHDTTDEVTASESVSELSEQYQATDLLLDVRTVNWSFIYFPSDWNNYKVIYSVKLRLIDTQAREIMAEGFCIRNPEQTADAPSHDQLLAHRAARLKEELKIAANFCIDEFKTKVLRM